MFADGNHQAQIRLDHQLDRLASKLGLLWVTVVTVVDNFPAQNLFRFGCQQRRLANLTHVCL